MTETKYERLQRILDEPLPRSFYARNATVVAPELLNCILISVSPEGVTAGRVAETEAYTQDDPASHTYRGRTPRCEVMFGRAGHAYVYFTYGMHYCLNAVTGLNGQGEAVLIRAIEPLFGTELMCFRRGLSVELSQFDERIAVRAGRFLGAGPAKLCRSLGISAEHNGVDLTVGSDLWISASNSGDRSPSDITGAVVATPRIGIMKAVDLKRRFTMDSDPFTSRASKT